MGGPAGYDAPDLARFAAEPPKRSGRSAFERDRARVVHSAALRRLAFKTQVVGPGSDDFVRNRLTHSLEVAQVGRELGKALGCDPDVVDAACLAHDLGHPPFGHNGETVLDRVADSCGGFEGNAQTLRVLTRLEAKTVDAAGRSAGLNLTRAALDAATKYPWQRGDAADGSAKFGVYADDLDVFTWLRDVATPRRRCVEAQVMDFADDVAYSVHDVEDAVVAGRVELADLDAHETRQRVGALVRDWYDPQMDDARVEAAFDRLTVLPWWVRGFDGSRRSSAVLKDLTSQLIGRFCAAVEAATHARYGRGPLTRYAADLVVPAEVTDEVVVLKGVAAVFVMAAADRAGEYEHQREVLGELVDALRERGSSALERSFAVDYKAAADDHARLRVVVDQVASLTDESALAWHTRLTR
ncbi:MAG: deoxyguanosinetriphosphate triphosphohydrolase [Jiangellales bacterium]